MSGVDGDKLNGLVGKMLGDLGGAFNVPTARIGFRWVLFACPHNGGPATPRSWQRSRTGRTICARMGVGDAANGFVVRCSRRKFSLCPNRPWSSR